MTQQAFDSLPMLLKRRQVMEVLGVSDESLRTLRALRFDLVVVRVDGKLRYCKKVVAELARLEYR